MKNKKLYAQLDKLNGRKPKPKRLTIPKIKIKYEPIVRDLIIILDGGKCQIAGYRHTCSDKLVADHRPVKRGNNRYFFDRNNLTCVCSVANFLAELDPLINYKICEVVKKRIGEERFSEMEDRKKIPFKITEEYVLGVIEKLEALCQNSTTS